jgi:hypothetical protein
MRPPETTRSKCRQTAGQKAGPDHLHEPDLVEVVDPAGAAERHRRTPTAHPDCGRCAGAVPRHPRAANTTERGSPTPPPPEALRPLARALVALALEVRAEGLAPGQKKRSHLPSAEGGRPCAA